MGDRAGHLLTHRGPDEDTALESVGETGLDAIGPEGGHAQPARLTAPPTRGGRGPGAGRSSVQIGEGGGVEARVSGKDAGGGQLPIVVPLTFRTVETFGVGSAAGGSGPVSPGVGLGAAHQVCDLLDAVGHPFADPPARGPVDHHEEGGPGDFVVAPGFGGHHHRQVRR